MKLPALSPLALAFLTSTTAAQNQIPIISTNAPSSIPLLGFGTWNLNLSPSNTSSAVSAALNAGYRHVDCAAIYGNEVEVGRGIKHGLEAAGLKREDVWVTSKLWNDHHAPEMVEQGLDQTLQDLGLEYLDLYLMHWPVASDRGKNGIDYLETWNALTILLSTPKVRHIGISNFSPSQLKTLLASSDQKPYAHQFELHPYLQQTEWLEFHTNHSIHVTAYSPLANLNPIYNPTTTPSIHPSEKDNNEQSTTPPSILENTAISNIAKHRNCTNAQVALKWGMQRGTSVIPKSSHESRIEENFAALDCVLEKADIKVIEEVGEKWVKRYNNPSSGWGVDLFDGLDGT